MHNLFLDGDFIFENYSFELLANVVYLYYFLKCVMWVISNTIANKFLNGVGTEDNLDWRYIWYALDSAIAGNQVDKLTFDMGKWSDAHDVKKIKICLPQDNVKHTRLVQSFLLAILLLAVLIAVSRLIAL